MNPCNYGEVMRRSLLTLFAALFLSSCANAVDVNETTSFTSATYPAEWGPIFSAGASYGPRVWVATRDSLGTVRVFQVARGTSFAVIRPSMTVVDTVYMTAPDGTTVTP